MTTSGSFYFSGLNVVYIECGEFENIESIKKTIKISIDPAV